MLAYTDDSVHFGWNYLCMFVCILMNLFNLYLCNVKKTSAAAAAASVADSNNNRIIWKSKFKCNCRCKITFFFIYKTCFKHKNIIMIRLCKNNNYRRFCTRAQKVQYSELQIFCILQDRFSHYAMCKLGEKFHFNFCAKNIKI